VLLLQLYVLLLQLQLQGRDGGGNVCGDSRLRCQKCQVYLHCKPSGLKCGYGGSGGHLRGVFLFNEWRGEREIFDLIKPWQGPLGTARRRFFRHRMAARLLPLLLCSASSLPDWTLGDVGVDRPGFDLDGSPFPLASASDASACGAACASAPGCAAWSFSTCAPFNCSLKFGAPNATNSSCAVSGFSARPLAPLAHAPLPVGSLAPAGWLRAQLQLEADGLTGHLADFYPDVMNSSWVGGVLAKQNEERFPYWFNGVVPLAHALRDERLLRLVGGFVDAILAAVPPSGWLGPDVPTLQDRNYWNKYKMLLALAARYEATGDERLPAAMLAHLREMARRLWAVGLGELWSAARVEDLAAAVAWLAERGGPRGGDAAPWLFDFADRLYARRGHYDWEAFFGGAAFPGGTVSVGALAQLSRAGTRSFYHGVDAAEALKSGAVWWRFSGDGAALASSASRAARVEAAHGMPGGELCADEHLCGAMPSHGTEVCVIVEMLASYAYNAAASGDAATYERVERLALNALPAAYTKDMWHHPYLHQTNEIRAVNVSTHPWLTDGPAANTYGVDGGGTGCCTTNGGTGWPAALGAALRATAGGGLALGLLLPLAANATLRAAGGAAVVRVEVDTDYPFGDEVRVRVAGAPPGGLPFDLRVPSWVGAAAAVAVNGGAPAPAAAAAGTFLRLSLPEGDSAISFATDPRVRLSRWFNGAVAVERGALVYALQLEEKVAVTREWGFPNASDLNVTTDSPWNYALLVADPQRPAESFNFSQRGPPSEALPWGAGAAVPVAITAWARRVAAWGEALNAAGPPPPSPACAAPAACGPPELVTLVPHGSTLLRITEFPLA
jgi:hypothetical protein